MPRKSDQQLSLEEQKRFYMACMRKARIHKQRMDYAKLIAAIDAQLYPDPAQEAREAAKAAKLQLKVGKVAAAQAKKAEAAELERLKEIEHQKIRDEENPVMDHVKRAVIRAGIREQTTTVADQVPDTTPPIEATVLVTQETITTPETVAPPTDGGVVVSPELATITREAEESAKRQSSTKRNGGMLDFFKKVTQPLESRDVTAPLPPPRRFLADLESSGPGETSARLAAGEHAREVRALSPENQGMELVTDWAGNQEWRQRGQE